MASIQLILLFSSVCLIVSVTSQPDNLAYRRMFHPLYRRQMQRFNNNPPPYNNNRGPWNNNPGPWNNNRRPFDTNQGALNIIQRLFSNRGPVTNQGPFGNNRGPPNGYRGPPRNFNRRFHPLSRRPPPSMQRSNPFADMDFADVLRMLLMRQLTGGNNFGGFNGNPMFAAQPAYAMSASLDPDLPDAPDAPAPTAAPARRGRGGKRLRRRRRPKT